MRRWQVNPRLTAAALAALQPIFAAIPDVSTTDSFGALSLHSPLLVPVQALLFAARRG